MSKRLKAKRALIVATRPLYSKWLADELSRLIPWFKTQFTHNRSAMLDDYNQNMIKELEPHLDKALRYLDIPFHKVWVGSNIVQYNFWKYGE